MYSKTKDLLRFAKEAKAQLAHSRAFVRHMIEIVDTNKPTELDSILANIESARQYIDSVITEISKTGAMPATLLMDSEICLTLILLLVLTRYAMI